MTAPIGGGGAGHALVVDPARPCNRRWRAYLRAGRSRLRLFGSGALRSAFAASSKRSALAGFAPEADSCHGAGDSCAIGMALPAMRRSLSRNFVNNFLGDWQGLPREGFFAGRAKRAASYWFGPADERAPGGESFSDLCARVEPAIAALTEGHRGRDIVCVAHGGTIRAALRAALGIPAETALGFAIANCGLTRIDHVALTG